MSASGRGAGGFLGTRPGLAVGALACCLLWGSAVPGVSLGYGHLGIGSGDAGGQKLYSGVRFILAGACIGAWAVLAWLVAVSAVAYTVWSVLLASHPVSSVVAYSFTLPLFGVVISLLTLGDQGHPLGAAALASIAVVCLGIWLVETPAKGRR